MTVTRLAKIRLICRALERSAEFYERAFGFEHVATTTADHGFAELLGAADGGVRVATLQLGEQVVELLEVERAGRSYPSGVSGWNPLFQHFAIVVSDMHDACARLTRLGGWTAISTDGPQSLPASSGGVTAFKFRDPEGHPLEFLVFPTGPKSARWQKHGTSPCLGIDHSAISVADSARSVDFYRHFGLRRVGGSFNAGPEQEKLDDIADARVEVTALAPPHATPHVELLCYRGKFDRSDASASANDVAATQLVFDVDNSQSLSGVGATNRDALVAGPITDASGISRALLRDPDGHLFCLEAPSATAATTGGQHP